MPLNGRSNQIDGVEFVIGLWISRYNLVPDRYDKGPDTAAVHMRCDLALTWQRIFLFFLTCRPMSTTAIWQPPGIVFGWSNSLVGVADRTSTCWQRTKPKVWHFTRPTYVNTGLSPDRIQQTSKKKRRAL